MHHRFSLAAVIAALIALMAGCGKAPASPTSPTPTPNQTTPAGIAGNWTGALRATIDGSPGTIAVTFEVRQTDRDIAGSWQATRQDLAGSITGTVTGTGTNTRFVGDFSMSSVSTQPGQRCTGNAHVEGIAAASALTWTSPGFDIVNCTGTVKDLTFAMSR